jgi:hypothetical protein
MEEVAQSASFILICRYHYADQVMVNKVGGGMWHIWERKVYKVLVGKPEGKRPLGRPRHRWEDGFRMDLKEIGWGVGWSGFNSLRIWAGRGCCEYSDKPGSGCEPVQLSPVHMFSC